MLHLLLPAVLAVQAMALMELSVPEQPVVALYGQDATLNCSFSHSNVFNLSDLSIFWQLTDTKRNVHTYSEGRDLLVDQAEGFANRTSLFPTQLKLGNASLLLSKVVVADEGSYTCFVRVQDYGRAALFLQVAAPYTKPVLTLEPESNLRPGDKVALTCVAYGGYPAGGVVWQDGSGHNLTENVTISLVANEEGLFTMTSILTVTLEPNSTYSCLLINPLLGEEGYAFVTITDAVVLCNCCCVLPDGCVLDTVAELPSPAPPPFPSACLSTKMAPFPQQLSAGAAFTVEKCADGDSGGKGSRQRDEPGR